MANRAYLYVSDTEGLPGFSNPEQVLGADYFIPPIWISSLEPAQLKHKVIDAAEGQEIYYFCVKATEALSRCQANFQSLKEYITNIDTAFQNWVDFLQSLDNKYIQIDVTEVLLMDDEALSEFKQALTFLETPTQGTAESFLRLSCLSDIYDPSSKSVKNMSGKTVAEISGDPNDLRHSPEFDALTHMLGYGIAPWVPWTLAPESDPANSGPKLSMLQKLSWHPISPFVCTTYVLYEVVGTGLSGFGAIALSLTGGWLVLTVYNLASGGKFTSWLYQEEQQSD